MRIRGLIGAAGSLAMGVALLSTAPLAPSAEALAPAAPPVQAMSQEVYLATMRGLLAGKPGDAQSDQTLIDGGKSICKEIDGGATYDTFLGQMDQFDLNRAIYRVIIRSSVLTFCPMHESVLR